MNRREARELALRMLYSMDLTGNAAGDTLNTLNADNFTSLAGEDALYKELPDSAQRSYIAQLVYGVRAHQEELDETIRKFAIGWKLERISRITLSVLRLCLFELQYADSKDVPPAASINEAVELAKLYDGQEAGAFVNGILGSYMRAKAAPAAEVKTEA